MPSQAAYVPWPNALVQPIIQLHQEQSHDAKPDAAADRTISSDTPQFHVPAVETWVDFDQLNRTASADDDDKDDEEDFRITSVSMKRQRPNATSQSSPAKRIKTETQVKPEPTDDTPKPQLFSTSILFQADQSQGTNGTYATLASSFVIKDVRLEEVVPLSTLEADILDSTSAISVRCPAKPESHLPICILPIVDSNSQTFPQEANPQGFTNGPWFPAALRLARAGLLRLQCDLHVEHRGAALLELQVTVSLGPNAVILDDVERHTSSSSSSRWSDRRIIDLMQVARFATGQSTAAREEEAQRRRGLDASAIYSILSPARVEASADIFQPEDLSPTLLPFQRRSSAFLLAREGLQLSDDSKQLVAIKDAQMTSQGPSKLGTWWSTLTPNLYYHCLTGAFATNTATTRREHIQGALLAEEMGLGKTVEVLALILLHAAPKYRTDMPPYEDSVNDVSIKPVKTTLIVCPALLQDQWRDEIHRHAPSLQVYSFLGHVQAEKDIKQKSMTWHDFASECDVIIVNFTTLQRELSVAMKEAPRSRRAPRKYERPRCPLIQLEFYRVVCDEIQMVGNTTRAAEVVSMIPRTYSIAVSGTPVKHINDLNAFFRFLRIDDVHPSLLKDEASSLFAPHLFRTLRDLTTRHLKSAVKKELTLPQQHRYVMPIDFTAVETAYYEDVWNTGLQVLGLDASGGPTRQDWELDESLMRRHLLLLRQACTHPQVAGRILGSGNMAQGNLRTMAEVLAYMKEQAISERFKSRSTAFSKAIDRAAVLLQDKEDDTRFEITQAQLESTIKTLQADCKVLEQELQVAIKEGPGYRFSSEEVQALKAKYEGGGEPRDNKEIARVTHRQTISARLRIRTEHLARAAHWLGNVFFQRGELEVDESSKEELKKSEDQAYDLAEQTRQSLLREAREAVDRSIATSQKLKIQFGETGARAQVDFFESPGIKTETAFKHILERLDLLNSHTAIVFAWRKRIVEALYSAVNREVSEENPEDDQYAEALDTQHNAEVLLATYRPLLARRQALLTEQTAVGSTNVPAAMKDLLATLKVVQQANRRAQLTGQSADQIEQENNQSLEQQVLGEVNAAKLAHYRVLCKEMESVSLESLISEQQVKQQKKDQQRRLIDKGDREEEAVEELGPLSNMQLKLRHVVESEMSDMEVAVAREALLKVRSIIKHQNTVLDALRKEMEALTKVFNARAEYFKQLQALSDDLVDIPIPEGKLSDMLSDLQRERDKAMVAAGKQESRLRYLEHLGKMEAEGLDEDARKCIICTEEISVGLLLAGCGHIVCQKCFSSWYSQHRTCPICRAKIAGPREYHRVVYSRPEEEEEENNASTKIDDTKKARSKVSNRTAFNVAPMQLRRSIEMETCTGRYGSKLEMLVKHLHFIGMRDRHEKTIVFSAFPRGLELVSDALRHNGIRHVHVSGAGSSANTADMVRRFTQGTINVLLLQSEATSAGLNLMATKNIIMLEPLVNSGAERQALGRIHRIGQTKETNVFVYYVRDSVEERILRLAANRGQSLFLKPEVGETELDSGQVIADTIANKKERGDYVNSTDDLLSCFFSEHLDERDGEGGDDVAEETSSSSAAKPLTDAERAREARLEAIRRRELAADTQQQHQSSSSSP